MGRTDWANSARVVLVVIRSLFARRQQQTRGERTGSIDRAARSDRDLGPWLKIGPSVRLGKP